MRYAKFEFQNGEVALARRCYERGVEELGEDAQTVGHGGVCVLAGVLTYGGQATGVGSAGWGGGEDAQAVGWTQLGGYGWSVGGQVHGSISGLFLATAYG